MSNTPKITQSVSTGAFNIGGRNPLALIAGPCVIESEKIVRDIAVKLKRITEDLGVPFIFKASYDKANRSSIQSFRGPGLKEGLKILQKIKTDLDIPILSDVHKEEEVEPAAEVLDILQIPA
ncbi:MAG: 3-deoxy-8-phosphooctulonate synthase, partial [Nitrospinae bacterium CG22_combo_CG10-13_8_21_14_all_47_10]